MKCFIISIPASFVPVEIVKTLESERLRFNRFEDDLRSSCYTFDANVNACPKKTPNLNGKHCFTYSCLLSAV
jgi:hypothetical protein